MVSFESNVKDRKIAVTKPIVFTIQWQGCLTLKTNSSQLREKGSSGRLKIVDITVEIKLKRNSTLSAYVPFENDIFRGRRAKSYSGSSGGKVAE